MECPQCATENPEDSKFCKECASSLTDADVAHPSLTKTLETPTSRLAIGSRLAERYLVLEELARGPMGVVYKAEDSKLKRTVVIKLLLPEPTGDIEAKERFIRIGI